mmetsp:Transcript_5661/g.12283  ORF Transcript_5661/g.12283 Transcript_5661/m.12283 type:complete len:206 (+) Transcript_5661:100-717(+)
MDKLNAVFKRFKEVAEKKKGGLDDDDLESLVSDQAGSVNELWRVTGLQTTTGLSGIPTATVKMMGPDALERYISATGTGPVDAVYKAIDQIMGVSVVLESYSMNSVNEGIEALASTRVVIVPTIDGPNDSAVMDAQTSQLREKKFSGSGSDTDIITSSARAYVSALNKLLTWKIRRMANGAEEADTTGTKDALAVEGEPPSVVVN